MKLLVFSIFFLAQSLAEDLIKCGMQKEGLQVGEKMEGGLQAKVGAWPWQVSLLKTSDLELFCGGSILNKYWVITAAHCFKPRNIEEPGTIKVGLGVHQLDKPKEWTVYKSPKNIFVDERFDPTKGKHDIAMLQMREPMEFGDYVRPVCFPDNSTFAPEEWVSCHVTGWRFVNGGKAEEPRVLRQAPTRLIPSKTCNQSDWYNGTVDEGNFCAGWAGRCQGDGGGPLVCLLPNSERWILIGIMSWGSGCNLPKRPVIYTSTKHNLDWVRMTMEESRRGSDLKEFGSESEIRTRMLSSKARIRSGCGVFGTLLLNLSSFIPVLLIG
ncbi:Acrosin [Acipenser ruthenus]|uniref:Acrosin n=1 Tax=Acipenser ruthenus TaxID=7906 RepID=A0A662YMU7_ACIRT|nr:Acrosin [Acipenser ruthenus]